MNRVPKSPIINRFSHTRQHRSPRPSRIKGLTPTAPQFGGNNLSRSVSALSTNQSGVGSAWRQSIPLIAVASSVGLIILGKLTGYFEQFQWHWPPNPFVRSRHRISDMEHQASPENTDRAELEPLTPVSSHQTSVSGQQGHEPAIETQEATPEQSQPETAVKSPLPEKSHSAHSAERAEASSRKRSPQTKSPAEPEGIQDSLTLPPLTQTALMSLLASPSMQSVRISPRPTAPGTPYSVATEESFEMVGYEDRGRRDHSGIISRAESPTRDENNWVILREASLLDLSLPPEPSLPPSAPIKHNRHKNREKAAAEPMSFRIFKG